MRVAVDAMGGDNAPMAAIDGVRTALTKDPDLSVTLVATGDTLRLAEQLLGGVSGQLSLFESGPSVPDGHHPAQYLRRHPDASIAQAITQVRDGKADAALGVGHTGGVMIAARWILGTVPGVDRPAPAGVLPLGTQPVVIDLGVTSEVGARDLLAFAALGCAFARAMRGIREPRVALVANGREEGKGTHAVQEAYSLFRDRVPNFVGYLEAVDMVQGEADVLVVDGYIGNLILKWMEGMSRVLEEIGGATGRLAEQLARMRDITLSDLPIALLGVPGVVLPGHGRAQSPDVARLIGRAADAVRGRLVELVQQEVVRFLGEMT